MLPNAGSFWWTDAHWITLFNLCFKTKLETGAKIISVYNAYSPHDLLVYPPKIYFPTLIIVTVGPLPSHREWNVLAAQPSTDARQQRFQREFMPLATGASQLPNEVKWFFLFPTITESSKPVTQWNMAALELVKRLASGQSVKSCRISA